MNRQQYARVPKARTATDRRTGMILSLYQCRPAALAAMTADDLVRYHGVDRKTAEYELTAALQKRAGEQ